MVYGQTLPSPFSPTLKAYKDLFFPEKNKTAAKLYMIQMSTGLGLLL